MKNISIIYDNKIDIWWNDTFRTISLNPSSFISVSETTEHKREYDYSQLNLTGRILDLRTSI